MVDANYFKSVLARDVQAAGGAPVVEIILRSGHVHRLRAVAEVNDGWVTLEAYTLKGDLTHERPRFGATDGGHEIMRVVVAYEAISGIVLDPAPAQVKARTGFGFTG